MCCACLYISKVIQSDATLGLSFFTSSRRCFFWRGRGFVRLLGREPDVIIKTKIKSVQNFYIDFQFKKKLSFFFHSVVSEVSHSELFHTLNTKVVFKGFFRLFSKQLTYYSKFPPSLWSFKNVRSFESRVLTTISSKYFV